MSYLALRRLVERYRDNEAGDELAIRVNFQIHWSLKDEREKSDMTPVTFEVGLFLDQNIISGSVIKILTRKGVPILVKKCQGKDRQTYGYKGQKYKILGVAVLYFYVGRYRFYVRTLVLDTDRLLAVLGRPFFNMHRGLFSFDEDTNLVLFVRRGLHKDFIGLVKRGGLRI